MGMGHREPAMSLTKGTRAGVCRMCSPSSWQCCDQSRNCNQSSLVSPRCHSWGRYCQSYTTPFLKQCLGKGEKTPIINDPLGTCGDELGVGTSIRVPFALPSLGCRMLERDWQRMRLGRLAEQTVAGAKGHVQNWGFCYVGNGDSGKVCRSWKEDGCVNGGIRDFSHCPSTLSTLNSGQGKSQWARVPRDDSQKKKVWDPHRERLKLTKMPQGSLIVDNLVWGRSVEQYPSQQYLSPPLS